MNETGINSLQSHFLNYNLKATFSLYCLLSFNTVNNVCINITHLIPGHCIFPLGISVIPRQQAWLNEISKRMEYKLMFSYEVILNWYFIISYTNKSIKRLFRRHLGLFWLLTGYFGYSYHHLVTLVSSTNKTDRWVIFKKMKTFHFQRIIWILNDMKER